MLGVLVVGRGGARIRSGPAPKADSGRSHRRKYTVKNLPPRGRSGRSPEFPLKQITEREREIWTQLWKLPQAVAWSMPENQWMKLLVAQYARVMAYLEDSPGNASLYSNLHRFGDQIGLTPAGLAALGWSIGDDNTADTETHSKPSMSAGGAKSRMRIINGGEKTG